MNHIQINFSLSAEDQLKINEAFKTIIEVLKPHTVVLTDHDRQTLPKMADKTLPFAEKVASYAVSNPEFKPDYVNAEELKININGFKESSKLLTPAYQVVRVLEDISILSGSEAYSSSLSYYRNVKSHTIDKRPGAQTIYDDLKQRFINQGNKGDGPDDNP